MSRLPGECVVGSGEGGREGAGVYKDALLSYHSFIMLWIYVDEDRKKVNITVLTSHTLTLTSHPHSSHSLAGPLREAPASS